MAFQITLRDRSVEIVDEADTFAHDKTMTTFYRTANERRTVDCWAVPVASVRTEEILMVRQVEMDPPPPADLSASLPAPADSFCRADLTFSE